MPSILDFFKPVRKDKRRREEDAEDLTQHILSVAGRMPPNSYPDAHHEPRNDSVNKPTETLPVSSNSEHHSNHQAAKKAPINGKYIVSSTTPTEAPEHLAGLSEYERKRQAKMAANAKFLQELGVASAQLDVTREMQREQQRKATQTKKRSKPKRIPQEVQPVRRSRRLRGETAPGSKQQTKDNEEESEPSDEPDEYAMEVSFAESSVLRYSVAGGEDVRKAPPSSSEDGPGRELMGFQLDPKAYLADHELKKAYSISFSTFHENGLVAAGGTNGRVAIFPFTSSYHQPEIVDGVVHDSGAHTPLMSFKAHSGWISAVSLARSIRGKANLLLTASNDATVKLWDLDQSSAMLRMPKEIFTSTHLHHKGIFGLDVCGDSVLTCSKDATIALSKFCPGTGTLLVDQRFEDHKGVVKCVQFAPSKPQVFASGGNDRELRVYDARTATNALVMSIQDVHFRAINSVQFHSTDENLLLSAGFDPNFYMFDLRKAASPVCTFLTSPQSKDDSKAIFHPIFVRNGQGVVAARGHDLSVYRTSDGAAVSRGYIDDAATCIAVDPFHDRITIAQAGKLQFANAQ
ncbi:hypothetical protein PRIC1_006825 [Phytophthora ramorum]